MRFLKSIANRVPSRFLSRTASSLATLFLLLVVFALPGSAQDYVSQPGSPAFSVNQPVVFGFTNLANGNIHLEIPIASAPQRGEIGFAMKLVYDSRIWQVVKAGGSLLWKPTNVPNSMGGWRVVSSANPGTVTFDSSSVSCDGTNFLLQFTNFVWQGPDGTRRKFPIATAQGQGCPGDTPSGDSFAADASGYHMYVTGYQNAVVYAKDGTQVFPAIQDTNGNHFSTDANGNVIDTLARTVVTTTTSGNQTFYDVLNSQGKTSRITVTTRSIQVATFFRHDQSGITDDQEMITVVDSLTLPTGDKYTFTYDEAILNPPGGPPNSFIDGYGMLQSIALNGTTVANYSYTSFIDAFGVVNRWAAGTLDGSVTYSVISPTQQKAVVQRPQGNSTGTLTYTFNMNGGAWNTDIATDSIPDAVHIVKSYNFNQTCAGCQGAANVTLSQIRETHSIPSGPITSQSVFTYDGPQTANVTKVQQWNFYAGDASATPPAAPDRQTVITYNTDAALVSKNIINRVQSVSGQDGSGAQLTLTQYAYDTTALTTLPGPVVNHADVDSHRGNLTKISQWTGGSSFLDTLLTYDTTGQIVAVKDSLGNVTNLSYADNFYNDDGTSQPPSANPSQATNAYLTSITLPSVGQVQAKLQSGYYLGTGKQAFQIDPNGQKSYTHFVDALDRVTQVVSPKGWRAMAYPSLLSVDAFSGLTDSQPSVSCSGCIHESDTLDVLGRVVQSTLVSDPDGAVSSEMTYDPAGNLLTVANPHRGPKTVTSTNSYDSLYRPTQTVHPDGSVSQIFYGSNIVNSLDLGRGGNNTQYCLPATYGTGFPVLSINEIGQRRQVWFNAFGKIIEADEPDATGALIVPTCYQYNIGNELVKVVQGELTRAYLYDHLWRVTQVTTPEAGTETYSYVNDDGSLCGGASSAVCKRVDARGIATRYQYDPLGRLTKTTYSDGTPTAFYNYDESSSSIIGAPLLTNTIGKISSTYTQDAKGKMLTGEVFSYDPAGNLIDNSQCTPQNCGTGVFSNSYVPDQLGNIVNFNNSWGRNLSAKYDNAGQVTSLNVTPNDATHPASIFSNAKYDQFGGLISANLGNGLLQAADYSGARGWLSSVRVGSRASFVPTPPGNVATPAMATVSVSGSLQHLTTTAQPGTATLNVSGSLRSISDSNAAPSTITLTVAGNQQVKQNIDVPGVPGIGTVSMNGALQSKQTTVPGAQSTGSFTINGTLQFHEGSEAIAGRGTVSFSGSEQSKSGPSTPGVGTVTIGGTESSTTVDPCADQTPTPSNPNPSCPRTVFDTGTVSVTVNGFTQSVSYSSNSNSGLLAASLVTGFNSNSASPVTASANGSVVTLTSKAGGSASNYALSASSSTSDVTDFGTASFTASPSGATLTGGSNGPPPVFDSGTCSVTLNGTVYSTAFDKTDTAATINSRLAGLISNGTLANASVSSATMTLTAKQTGAGSNYPLASSCTYNSPAFSSPSFAAAASGSALTGGTNPGPSFYDSGSLTVTIGSFVAKMLYGQDPQNPDTSAGVTSTLAALLSSSQSPVTATASGSTLNLTYKKGGTAGNVSFTCSSASTQGFNPPSFTCPSAVTMSGGTDLPKTLYDSGTVNLSVGNFTVSAPYSQTGNSSSAQIASALATGLNISSSPVTATVSGNVINLTAKSASSSSNYSLNVATTYDSADFSGPSFSAAGGSALSGGKDPISTPLYDSGTLSVIVNGHTNTTAWGGSGVTTAGLATAVAREINLDAGAPVTATASGNLVTLTSKAVGANTNYGVATLATNDKVDFPDPLPPSFSIGSASGGLTGGHDANSGASAHDSGTITVTVNGFSETVPYGSSNPNPLNTVMSTFNADPNSPVWVTLTQSGQLLFTARKVGSSTNHAVSASSTTTDSRFTGSSYAVGFSGSALSGGVDSSSTQTQISDTGVVTLSVGSFNASIPYCNASSCDAPGVAVALGNVINQSAAAPVMASVVGAQITLVSKKPGAAGNYSLSANSQSNDPTRFSTPSFTLSPASGALAGGADKPNPAAGGSSTAVVTISGGRFTGPVGPYADLVVNGQLYRYFFALSDTPATIAAALAQMVNGAGSPVTATASNGVVFLQSAVGGSATNYPVSLQLNNAANATNPPPLPFTATISAPNMAGGADSNTFVYALDVGTDPSGTIFGASDSVNGNWQYIYDNLGRLEQAFTPSVGYKYDYDRYGNRLHQTPLNGGAGFEEPYINNQISDPAIQYDASGNLVRDGNHTYSYDAEGRLISVDGGQTATYIYNADGLRVRSTVGAAFSDYIHDSGGGTVGVLGANGGLIRQEFGGLATYTSTGAYFHHRDWLGNLRAVTDQNGAIQQTCTNLPFGDALNCSAAGTTPTYFTGYMRDGETNLDFANARYFSSQFGRFMSPDPHGGGVGDPQSLNLYAYVLNNPLSAVDPSGMDACVQNGEASAICGFIVSGGGGGSSGGPFGVFGGPFGTGDAFNFNGPNIGLCFFVNCAFGSFGSAVAGPPSLSQVQAEAILNNVLQLQVGYEACNFCKSWDAFTQRLGNVLGGYRWETDAELTARKAKECAGLSHCPEVMIGVAEPEAGLAEGAFSIHDWSGYPRGLPRPSGPFRILQGEEYTTARAAANQANRTLRQANPQTYGGQQVHEIHPVKFGGSPTAPANKAPLAPAVHSQYTTWWNALLRSLQ
ncbi:MAG TPA: RHS repeat-associated core domain-containing protein [Candidatus Angelobacter sp.]|nr:RHS repeat-associated core domain-containing protein [Candidatus Angelobacter sp.]